MDVQWLTALVEACSDTLENVDIEYRAEGELRYPSASPVGLVPGLKLCLLWTRGYTRGIDRLLKRDEVYKRGAST